MKAPRDPLDSLHADKLAQLNKKMARLFAFRVASPFFLAPMMNVTTPAFQALCAARGAGLCVTPMVFLDFLVNRPEEALEQVGAGRVPRPFGIQVIGNTPGLVKPALDVLSSVEYDFVDLNAACPASRELKRGVGGALLHDHASLKKILNMLDANAPKPYTVKIRAGFSGAGRTFAKIRAALKASACSAIVVHGRTVTQGFSGQVEYAPIREVVLDNPDKVVVGNGDVNDPASAARMFEDTGCDAVMVGRAAIGKPFVFERLGAALEGALYLPPTMLDAVREYRRFLDLTLEEDNLKRTKVSALRSQFQWFLKSFHDARKLRREISGIENIADLIHYAENLKRDLKTKL
ncbi:MAG: tRNA dihydrouridine synthase [Promethearchaeota archaeon]